MRNKITTLKDNFSKIRIHLGVPGGFPKDTFQAMLQFIQGIVLGVKKFR